MTTETTATLSILSQLAAIVAGLCAILSLLLQIYDRRDALGQSLISIIEFAGEMALWSLGGCVLYVFVKYLIVTEMAHASYSIQMLQEDACFGLVIGLISQGLDLAGHLWWPLIFAILCPTLDIAMRLRWLHETYFINEIPRDILVGAFIGILISMLSNSGSKAENENS